MALVPPARIRNILVLGHTGTGKSVLVTSMVRAAGILTAQQADARPITDNEPEELDRGHSLALSAVNFTFNGHRFNVLDAPGGVEAVGDAYPALLAADIALFVVDATVGVQPQHTELWRACEARGLAKIVFLNKLDLERAQHQATIDELTRRSGTRFVAVQLPYRHDDALVGVIDLLHMTADAVGSTRRPEPLPAEVETAARHTRELLVETVVENDDALLERYLDGEQPTTAELAGHLRSGIRNGEIVPVLCGSASTGAGVESLLRFVVEACPSPADTDLLPLDAPTVAYVAKTFSDQYAGRINLLRVLSGQVRRDARLSVQRTGTRERIHNMFTMFGSEHEPVDVAGAGDLVAVSKLTDVVTGDLLFDRPLPTPIDIPHAPAGFHRVVLDPATPGDDTKLSLALQRVLQEDPAITSTLDLDSGTQILSFFGPSHLDVTVARLARRHGVAVNVRPAPIAYRTTIRRRATGTGRHVKQTGGHGQYAVATIEIAPRPRDTGFAFENASVGGVVPHSYVPSVEKGVLEAMRHGPIGGFPVVDVGVRLIDGKHHPVDSSDAAFQMAGILAFRAAINDADPVLLEPVSSVTVDVPDTLTGTVLSDLSARRGRIIGTSVADDGCVCIEAHVPDATLVDFAAELRALTGGQGEASIAYDHHAEVPDAVARTLVVDLAPA